MENRQNSVQEIVQDDACTAFITPEKQDEILRRMTALFQRSGMSVQQLAEVTYISESTITRYFSGKTKNPHFYNVCTMIIAMGGDVNEILGITAAAEKPAENPYGALLQSYQEQAMSLRAAVESFVKTRRVERIILAALVLVVAVFCVIELVDISRPDWGRYQYQVEAAMQHLWML